MGAVVSIVSECAAICWLIGGNRSARGILIVVGVSSDWVESPRVY